MDNKNPLYIKNPQITSEVRKICQKNAETLAEYNTLKKNGGSPSIINKKETQQQ